jgi:hypothetical protein
MNLPPPISEYDDATDSYPGMPNGPAIPPSTMGGDGDEPPNYTEGTCDSCEHFEYTPDGESSVCSRYGGYPVTAAGRCDSYQRVDMMPPTNEEEIPDEESAEAMA